jgi:ribosomal protein L11 methyltransferase
VIRLGIRVRAADAEIAYAGLEPVLADGCEVATHGDEVEFAVYEDIPDQRLHDLFSGVVSVTRTPVSRGWKRAWHDHLEPVTVGELTIRPPWLPGPGLAVDPGNTFGLASHPTTQLCLELLQCLPRTPLVDWGCGCGVLAAAAARLGYAPVSAIECDPDAVATARANGVDARVGDVTVDPPMAPTVVANLTAPLLAAAARAAARRGPATIVASGVLVAQADAAARAWRPAGFLERTRRERDGWVALVLERVP